MSETPAPSADGRVDWDTSIVERYGATSTYRLLYFHAYTDLNLILMDVETGVITWAEFTRRRGVLIQLVAEAQHRIGRRTGLQAPAEAQDDRGAAVTP